MKIKGITILVALSLTSAFAQHGSDQPSMSDCPMMSTEHAAAVDAHGDEAMGFSHAKTIHHFRMFRDGGAIEVVANDANDSGSRDQIRVHLKHIVVMFGEGNFNIPMFVHDQMPDGAATMQEMKDMISYHFQETEKGGQVRITTKDPKALAAIHEFMRFQIREHHTGDPNEVSE